MIKNEFGYYFNVEVISSEASIAQIQSNFQAQSRIFMRKMQKIKDWSDPVKREAMQFKQKEEEDKSKNLLEILEDQAWVRSGVVPFKIKDSVSAIE